jgi:hypothetical protein
VFNIAKIVQDFWILKDDGLVLFSRVFHEQVEDQLFGALLSALDSFAQQVSEGGLSNFELSNKRFTLIKKGGLLFIANSSKNVKEKKIIQELEVISQKFLEIYPENFFEEWDNDISIFQNFTSHIEDALEDPIKKFWNSF